MAEGEGERFLIVRDPHLLAGDYARFGIGVLPILQYFDGQSTLEDIRVDLAKQGAGFLDVALLQGVADALDRFYLLDNDTFRAEMRDRDGFRSSPVRRAAHAGTAYPADPTEARAFFDAMLALAEAPPRAPLRRLVAPHIDLGLGAEVYAHAHRRLAAAGRPDVVVVLGVRHEYGERRFVACRKDFATPLGTVRHDAAFLDALERDARDDLGQGVAAHRREHSVEFQACWLAHLWPEDPPPMVPLLVGSFHDFVEKGETPGGNPEVEAFVAALNAALEGRRAVVIASVDFAHLGPMYDQPEGLDADGERRMAEEDEVLLDHVAANSAEEFFAAVAADGNGRNVCGLAATYLALRLGEGPGERLRYGQGRIHPESGSVVSFAAGAFPD